MFSRILCPIDFDGNSLEALRMARGIAEQNKATLYVLHVVPPNDPMVVSAPMIAEQRENHARAELLRISQTELLGIDHETLLRSGHPAKEIIAAEAAMNAELVVMATHGRTGISHLVLGSVAEKVVRESSCSGAHSSDENSARIGRRGVETTSAPQERVKHAMTSVGDPCHKLAAQSLGVSFVYRRLERRQRCSDPSRQGAKPEVFRIRYPDAFGERFYRIIMATTKDGPIISQAK